MKFFGKTFWRFSIGFLVIIGISIFALSFSGRGANQEENEAQKYFEELEQEYREDTYGGKTPEETLQLFIDALKTGDTDLAAKYFVIDKQEEWKSRLEHIKKNNLLKDMIKDLEREKDKDIVNDEQVNFYIYNNDNILAVAISIIKNTLSNVWKIESL